MTPRADESPASASVVVRLSQNGIVVLALFYAIVLAIALPLGALAHATLDRIEQIRDVWTGGEDLGSRSAQPDQQSRALAVDELDSGEVEASFRSIAMRRDERLQFRDPRTDQPSLETEIRANVGFDPADSQHEAESQQALCQASVGATTS